MNQRFKPAGRPPPVLRAGMADGFSVNPEPWTSKPVNGYNKSYLVPDYPGQEVICNVAKSCQDTVGASRGYPW